MPARDTRRRGDRALTRNTLLAGAALCAGAVISAGVLMSGPRHGVDVDAVSSPHHGKALTIAWVDPAPQVVKRDPRTPLATPGPSLAAVKPAAKPDVKIAKVVTPRPKPAQLAAASPVEHELATQAPAGPKPGNDESTGVALLDAIDAAIRTPDVAAATPVRTESGLETVPATQPAVPPAKAAAVYFASVPLADSITTGSLGKLLADPADSSAAAAPEPDESETAASEIEKSNTAKPEALKPAGGYALAYAAPDHAAEKPAALARILPPRLPKARPPRKLTAYEKLYGGPIKLASLAPFDITRDDTDELPRAPYDRMTAVYVITEKKVYLPDGTVLEAHSGLGDRMDNPRFANMRMRGVTPPHVYRLKMREALFHGVEAIRMLPLGGSQAIYGRDGILAHTYMLGPSGQSNGCVSFKDYAAFLKAFKAGKIDRIAVIASLD